MFKTNKEIQANTGAHVFDGQGYRQMAFDQSSKGYWKQCNKEQICERKPQGKDNLKPNWYRADNKEPEYIDNWIEMLDILCESSKRIGMLGSSFFLGILVAMFIVPPIADRMGRRTIFIATMIKSVIGQVGLIYSNQLELSAFFFFILGATFPGKNIVGLSFLLEFVPEKLNTPYMTYNMIFDCSTLVLISLGYQHIKAHIFWLQVIGTVMTIIALLLTVFLMPESPRFLQQNNKFHEARESIKFVA